MKWMHVYHLHIWKQIQTRMSDFMSSKVKFYKPQLSRDDPVCQNGFSDCLSVYLQSGF